MELSALHVLYTYYIRIIYVLYTYYYVLLRIIYVLYTYYYVLLRIITYYADIVLSAIPYSNMFHAIGAPSRACSGTLPEQLRQQTKNM